VWLKTLTCCQMCFQPPHGSKTLIRYCWSYHRVLLEGGYDQNWPSCYASGTPFPRGIFLDVVRLE
jgi:hypothetical protein